MTKVIMNGCNGKMGQTITEICKADADIEIVAGIDLYDGIDNTGLLRGQAGSGCFMHYRS